MFTGTVEHIFIASAGVIAMEAVAEIAAVAGHGLRGDRYANGCGSFSATPGTGRQVTLIEAEALAGLLKDTGIQLAPAQTRRNLITRGVPLNHLIDREFTIGQVRLRGMRLCEPCSILEKRTVKGVVKGLLHRGGLRADILCDGVIRVGAQVQPYEGGQ